MRFGPWLAPRAATALVATGLLSACAPMRQGPDFPVRWQASPNVDARRVSFVVIHYTGDDSAAGALRTLTDPGAQVSAHYLIDGDGSIRQLVDERARAWHAGDSRWGGVDDVNSVSIGIELDNPGDRPFAEPQIESLLRLLDDIRRRHRLAAADFIGHADVAPARKIDPGPFFPWRRLAQHGFGLWCEPPLAAAPAGVDPLVGLRLIGYDTRQPAAAIAAFRNHHRPEAPVAAPLARDADLIACLAEQTLQRR